MEKSDQYSKFPWLDWFRFLAAFVVVLAHARNLDFVKYADLGEGHGSLFAIAFYTLTKLGNEAVLIFFVLSGFLVGGVALKRMSNGTFNLRDYAIDRFTRIMLPLVPALFLAEGVEYFLFGQNNWFLVIGNLVSLQGILVPYLPENAAMWTLSYEIWFYVLVGAVGLCFKNRYAGIALFFAASAMFLELFPHYLICWLIGAAAFLFRPKKSYKLIIFALVICAYGCLGRQAGRGSESVEISLLDAVLPSEETSRVIFSVGFALLVQQLILMRPKALARVDKIGSALGMFSYTLYLVHFPVIRFFQFYFGVAWMKDLNFHSIMIFSGVVVSCLAVALVMYMLFERHTAKVRVWMKELFRNMYPEKEKVIPSRSFSLFSFPKLDVSKRGEYSADVSPE